MDIPAYSPRNEREELLMKYSELQTRIKALYNLADNENAYVELKRDLDEELMSVTQKLDMIETDIYKAFNEVKDEV